VLWHNSTVVWDTLTHFFAHLLTFGWFTGAILLVVTIPACMYKIFSALWEEDGPDDDTPSYDRPAKAGLQP
jgi:hypothetical protein